MCNIENYTEFREKKTIETACNVHQTRILKVDKRDGVLKIY